MNIKTATTSDTDRLIFIVALITSRLAGEALDTFLGLSRASGALRIADSIKHVFSVISTAASGAEIHCFLACCTGILTGLTYAAHSSIPTWAFSYTLRWIAFFFEKQWQALIDAAFRASCSSADACRARARAEATSRSRHWFVKSYCTLSHASVLAVNSEREFSRALEASPSISNITKVKALGTRRVTTDADFVRITIRSGAVTTARLANTAMVIQSVEVLSLDLISVFEPTRRTHSWIVRQARPTREHTV